MRNMVLLFVALSMSGCASGPAMDYMLKEYEGTEPTNYAMPDDTYRIFDKPTASKLMITPSLGRAAGMGFVTGATFGVVDTSHNLIPYRLAAESYLKSTGRSHCQITSGTLLINPQYEFHYDCSTPAASAVVKTDHP